MKQRIITAIVAGAIFLPIAIYGGLPFVILVYLMATVGLFEAFRMKKMRLTSVPGIIGLLLLWFLLIPSSFHLDEYIKLSKLELVLIAVLLFLTYTVITKNKFSFDDVGFSLLSIIYVGLGFYYLIETRELGIIYLFFALFVIWTTDSGAYFIGRSMGKNKLWPEISPNKTIEGSLGGIVCAVIVATGFYYLVNFDEPLIVILFLAVSLSIFGQIGDLVESGLKRHYDVKDSGSLLPGHGGILDRFDSLLFILPILHFLHRFLA
ncbi:phosphatidate cytidylyltransferase [Sutcliffiella cohnii]